MPPRSRVAVLAADGRARRLSRPVALRARATRYSESPRHGPQPPRPLPRGRLNAMKSRHIHCWPGPSRTQQRYTRHALLAWPGGR
eukprot:8551477-Pyramimonas_sp.AAC.1